MPKLMNVPIGLKDEIIASGLCDRIGVNTATAVGMMVAVFGYLAENEPGGTLPDTRVIGRVVGLKGAKAAAFGEHIRELFSDDLGRLEPYVRVNGALVKNRERMARKQRERRMRGA